MTGRAEAPAGASRTHISTTGSTSKRRITRVFDLSAPRLNRRLLQRVDDEDERLAGRDHAAGAAVAVAHVGRDHEQPAAAGAHPLDAVVPARDHAPGADGEAERLGAPVPARVELAAGRPRDADVLHVG